MTYDVHAHIVPVELMELLRADGRRFGIETLREPERPGECFGSRPYRDRTLPPGSLRSRRPPGGVGAGGVQVQLASHRTDFSAYALEGENGAAYSNTFNRILADEVSRHPDRMLALGTVPLQSPAGAAEEQAFSVRELGTVGRSRDRLPPRRPALNRAPR